MARRYRRSALVDANLGWHTINGADQGRPLPTAVAGQRPALPLQQALLQPLHRALQQHAMPRQLHPLRQPREHRTVAYAAVLTQRGCGVVVQRLQVFGVVGPQQAGTGGFNKMQRQAEVRISRLGIAQRGSRHVDIAAAPTLPTSRGKGGRYGYTRCNAPVYAQPLMTTVAARSASLHAHPANPIRAVQGRTATCAAELRRRPTAAFAGNYPTGRLT